MLFLKVLLSIVSFGFLAGAIGTVAYDIYLAFQLDRILRRNDDAPNPNLVTRLVPQHRLARLPILLRSLGRHRVRQSGAPRRRIRWVIAAKLLALAASRHLLARVLSSCLTATRACA